MRWINAVLIVVVDRQARNLNREVHDEVHAEVAVKCLISRELIILPRVMFDHPDTIALDDLSPQDIANQLQRPIALADTMGDVWDALIGESKVLFQPGKTLDGPLNLRVLNDDDLAGNAHM